MKSAKGFSLIEIMVVLVIIGMLSAIIVPSVIGVMTDGQSTRVKSDFANIETALKMYKLHNHRYPSTEQGLDALVSMPETAPIPRNWRRGGYLPRLPKDPWDQPYLYYSPAQDGKDFEIVSLGADLLPGGVDEDADVSNWGVEP